MAIDNDRKSSIFFNIFSSATIFNIWLFRILFIFIDLIDVSARVENFL